MRKEAFICFLYMNMLAQGVNTPLESRSPNTTSELTSLQAEICQLNQRLVKDSMQQPPLQADIDKGYSLLHQYKKVGNPAEMKEDAAELIDLLNALALSTRRHV